MSVLLAMAKWLLPAPNLPRRRVVGSNARGRR